jgi:hypothetical protein
MSGIPAFKIQAEQGLSEWISYAILNFSRVVELFKLVDPLTAKNQKHRIVSHVKPVQQLLLQSIRAII